MFSDAALASPISLLLDLIEQHRRDVLSVAPALGKIWQEWIEFGLVTTAAAQADGGLGTRELPDRSPVQAESAGDVAHVQALIQQLVDLSVPPHCASRQATWRRRWR